MTMAAATFVFGIQTHTNGSNLNFSVHSQNQGLPDEIIITIMRHFLRKYEDEYQEKFKNS